MDAWKSIKDTTNSDLHPGGSDDSSRAPSGSDQQSTFESGSNISGSQVSFVPGSRSASSLVSSRRSKESTGSGSSGIRLAQDSQSSSVGESETSIGDTASTSSVSVQSESSAEAGIGKSISDWTRTEGSEFKTAVSASVVGITISAVLTQFAAPFIATKTYLASFGTFAKGAGIAKILSAAVIGYSFLAGAAGGIAGIFHGIYNGIKLRAEGLSWPKTIARVFVENIVPAAASFAVGVGVAVGLAALISNPVGWAILAGAVAVGVYFVANRLVKFGLEKAGKWRTPVEEGDNIGADDSVSQVGRRSSHNNDDLSSHFSGASSDDDLDAQRRVLSEEEVENLSSATSAAAEAAAAAAAAAVTPAAGGQAGTSAEMEYIAVGDYGPEELYGVKDLSSATSAAANAAAGGANSNNTVAAADDDGDGRVSEISNTDSDTYSMVTATSGYLGEEARAAELRAGADALSAVETGRKGPLTFQKALGPKSAKGTQASLVVSLDERRAKGQGNQFGILGSQKLTEQERNAETIRTSRSSAKQLLKSIKANEDEQKELQRLRQLANGSLTAQSAQTLLQEIQKFSDTVNKRIAASDQARQLAEQESAGRNRRLNDLLERSKKRAGLSVAEQDALINEIEQIVAELGTNQTNRVKGQIEELQKRLAPMKKAQTQRQEEIAKIAKQQGDAATQIQTALRARQSAGVVDAKITAVLEEAQKAINQIRDEGTRQALISRLASAVTDNTRGAALAIREAVQKAVQDQQMKELNALQALEAMHRELVQIEQLRSSGGRLGQVALAARLKLIVSEFNTRLGLLQDETEDLASILAQKMKDGIFVSMREVANYVARKAADLSWGVFEGVFGKVLSDSDIAAAVAEAARTPGWGGPIKSDLVKTRIERERQEAFLKALQEEEVARRAALDTEQTLLYDETHERAVIQQAFAEGLAKAKLTTEQRLQREALIKSEVEARASLIAEQQKSLLTAIAELEESSRQDLLTEWSRGFIDQTEAFGRDLIDISGQEAAAQATTELALNLQKTMRTQFESLEASSRQAVRDEFSEASAQLGRAGQLSSLQAEQAQKRTAILGEQDTTRSATEAERRNIAQAQLTKEQRLQGETLLAAEVTSRAALIAQAQEALIPLIREAEASQREAFFKEWSNRYVEQVSNFYTGSLTLVGAEAAAQATAELAQKARQSMSEQVQALFSTESEKRAKVAEDVTAAMFEDFRHVTARLVAIEATAASEGAERAQIIFEASDEILKLNVSMIEDAAQIEQRKQAFKEQVLASIAEIEDDEAGLKNSPMPETGASSRAKRSLGATQVAKTALYTQSSEQASQQIKAASQINAALRARQSVSKVTEGFHKQERAIRETHEMDTREKMELEAKNGFDQLVLLAKESIARAKNVSGAKLVAESIERSFFELQETMGRGEVSKQQLEELQKINMGFLTEVEKSIRESLAVDEAAKFAQIIAGFKSKALETTEKNQRQVVFLEEEASRAAIQKQIDNMKAMSKLMQDELQARVPIVAEEYTSAVEQIGSQMAAGLKKAQQAEYDRVKASYSKQLEDYQKKEQDYEGLQKILKTLKDQQISKQEGQVKQQAARELVGARTQEAAAASASAGTSGFEDSVFQGQIDGLTKNLLDTLQKVSEAKQLVVKSGKAVEKLREKYGITTDTDDIFEDYLEDAIEINQDSAQVDEALLPYLRAGSKLPVDLLKSAKEKVRELIKNNDIVDQATGKAAFHEDQAVLTARLVELILNTEPENSEFKAYPEQLVKRYLSTPRKNMRSEGEGGSKSRTLSFASQRGTNLKTVTRFKKIQVPSAIVDLAKRSPLAVKEGIQGLFVDKLKRNLSLVDSYPPPVPAVQIPIKLQQGATELPTDKSGLEQTWKANAPGAPDLAILSNMAEQGMLDSRFLERFGDSAAVDVVEKYIYPHWLLTRPENENYPGERATAENVFGMLSHSSGLGEKINLMLRTIATCSKPMAEGGLGGSPISRDQCRILANMRTGGYFHLEAGHGKSKAISLYPSIMGSDRKILHVSPFQVKSENPGVETVTIDTLRNWMEPGSEKNLKDYAIVLDEYDSMHYIEPKPVVQEQLLASGNILFQMSATQNMDDIHSMSARSAHKLDLLTQKVGDESTKKKLTAFAEKVREGSAQEIDYTNITRELDVLKSQHQAAIAAAKAAYPQGEAAAKEAWEDAPTEGAAAPILAHLNELRLERYIRELNVNIKQIKSIQEDKQKVWNARIKEPEVAANQEAVMSAAIAAGNKIGKSILVGFPDERDISGLVTKFKTQPGAASENTAIVYLNANGAEQCEVYSEGSWKTKTPAEFDELARANDPTTFCLYTANMRGGDFRKHSKERTAGLFIHYPNGAPSEDELCQHVWRDRSRSVPVKLYLSAAIGKDALKAEAQKKQREYNEISVRLRMRNKAAEAMRRAFEEALSRSLLDGYTVNPTGNWNAEFKRAQTVKQAVPGMGEYLDAELVLKQEDTNFLRKLMEANPLLKDLKAAKNIDNPHAVFETKPKNLQKFNELKLLDPLTSKGGMTTPRYAAATPRGSRNIPLKPLEPEEQLQLAALLKRRGRNLEDSTSQEKIKKLLERSEVLLWNLLAGAKKNLPDAGKPAAMSDMEPPMPPERFEYYLEELKKMDVGIGSSKPVVPPILNFATLPNAA